MSLEQAVQDLTQTTENLLVEVNTRKLDLVDAVNQAEQAAQTSIAQSENATIKAGEAAQSASLLGGLSVVVASGTVTLTAASTVYQLINPNGAARDVVLPTLAAADAGRAFSVKNTGTVGNFLTVKNAAGVQVGPALGNGYAMALVWSGAQWEAL